MAEHYPSIISVLEGETEAEIIFKLYSTGDLSQHSLHCESKLPVVNFVL